MFNTVKQLHQLKFLTWHQFSDMIKLIKYMRQSNQCNQDTLRTCVTTPFGNNILQSQQKDPSDFQVAINTPLPQVHWILFNGLEGSFDSDRQPIDTTHWSKQLANPTANQWWDKEALNGGVTFIKQMAVSCIFFSPSGEHEKINS